MPGALENLVLSFKIAFVYGRCHDKRANPALAKRPSLVRALVPEGVETTLNIENPDFKASGVDDLSASRWQIGCSSD